MRSIETIRGSGTAQSAGVLVGDGTGVGVGEAVGEGGVAQLLRIGGGIPQVDLAAVVRGLI
ncbi:MULTISPECIES: hypothetical protein [unclassified Microbacterium]|uniref:hypothetical protein n=1 Tax=unclassified Microbacterium TaxID=2609290 RepID=UPI003016CEB7